MQKKKIAFISAILAASLFLMFQLSACGGADQETFELSLAHFFPASHPAETIWVQGWAEALDEATDGRVKIVSYPGGTLLGANDIYNGVVEGVADLGISVFSYTPGRFPVLEAFELPGITYTSSRAASMVAWEGIKALDPEEIQDTKLLMTIATGPGDLFTKSPVTTLADLQGMEIRATGISTDTISALGGIPVGMPQSDTYDSLSKGVIQGNLSPVEVLKGWNHAEVTSYITKTPFLYNTMFFLTINLDKWNDIPDSLQEIIIEVSEKFHEETAAGLWDMQNEEALEYAVNEHNMEVLELSDTEAAIWIEKVMPIQDAYKQKLKDMGIDQDPLQTIYELSETYNELYK